MHATGKTSLVVRTLRVAVSAARDGANDVVDVGPGWLVVASDAHVITDVFAVADDKDPGVEPDADLVVAESGWCLSGSRSPTPQRVGREQHRSAQCEGVFGSLRASCGLAKRSFLLIESREGGAERPHLNGGDVRGPTGSDLLDGCRVADPEQYATGGCSRRPFRNSGDG